MIKKREPDFTTFVCLDFETTGLGREDKVTEIGAVKVVDGKMVSRYSTLVDPERPIPPLITRITGITDEMVAGKPTIEALLPSFHAYAKGFPLVAHNAAFDCRFLLRDAERAGLFFENEVFDTLHFAQRVLPGRHSYRLCDLAADLHIPQSTAHRAWCDAEATARLYMALKSK